MNCRVSVAVLNDRVAPSLVLGAVLFATSVSWCVPIEQTTEAAPPVMPSVAATIDSTKSALPVKPSISKARSALKEGRLAEARLHYAGLLKTDLSRRKRVEALYWVGMLGFAPDAEVRGQEETEAALAELIKTYPDQDRAREAGIVLALARRGAEELASLETRLAAATGSLDACRSAGAEADARLAAAALDSAGLKSALDTCRTEQAALREEVHRKDEILKGKDEALKKVKEVLVDWKAPR